MRRSTILSAVGVALVAIAPSADAALQISRWGLIDHYDLYGLILDTPLTLVFPLVIVAISCLPFTGQLSHRWISQTRTRASIRRVLGRRFGRIVAWSFAAGALFTGVPVIVAYALWPLWGDPGIDPAGAYMTADEAIVDSFGRDSYSWLLVHGPAVFGVAYSMFVGLAAASFGALGFAFLATVPNRFLALSLPLLLWMVWDTAAHFSGVPRASIRMSVFADGLSPGPLLETVLPTLVLFVMTIAFVTFAFVRAPRLRALS